MISIFTNPRPFYKEFDRIQRNAILSWLELKNVKIFVFDDEDGTSKEICEQYKIEHVGQIKKNKNGTPLVGDCLETIKNKSDNSVIAHVSTDIILTKDFVDTIQKVDKLFLNKNYYMIGQRINISNKLNFSKHPINNLNFDKLKESGHLHPPTATDYLIFSKFFKINMPPFVIGRPGWDSWLIAYCKKNNIPIIDSTHSITALHQNHSYPSKKLNYFKEECDYNFNLAGGDGNLMNIREADYIFFSTKNIIIRPKGFRFFLSLISKFKIYSFALIVFRKIKKLLQQRN
jgi:hypothetical protein